MPKIAQSPLEEFMTLPKPLVDWRGGKSPPQTDLSLLNAFGVSLRRLWRLKFNVPLPKQFSGSAPVACTLSLLHTVQLRESRDIRIILSAAENVGQGF